MFGSQSRHYLILTAHLSDFWCHYITKVFFCTRKPAFGILSVCTKKVKYTANRIGTAIVILWWCKRVHSKANKQRTVSSNRI